jgi:hypothetical protein
MTRHLLPDDEKRGRPLQARHVTVDGVSDEYADAHNAEDRSDSFQHGDDPNAQRSDLTACARAQSKGFPFDVEVRKRVMICCNTPKGQPVTKGGHEKGGLATAFLPSRSRHFTGRCGAAGRKPHERCEPGPILLCMGLFSRFHI